MKKVNIFIYAFNLGYKLNDTLDYKDIIGQGAKRASDKENNE